MAYLPSGSSLEYRSWKETEKHTAIMTSAYFLCGISKKTTWKLFMGAGRVFARGEMRLLYA